MEFKNDDLLNSELKMITSATILNKRSLNFYKKIIMDMNK